MFLLDTRTLHRLNAKLELESAVKNQNLRMKSRKTIILTNLKLDGHQRLFPGD
jgi:hypothetical protein